ARDPVLEPDRDLDDGIAKPAGPVHHLDLEGVSLGDHLVEPDMEKKVARVAPVARGGVAGREPEQDPAVEVGRPGQEPPVERPALDRTARDVTRTDRESSALLRRGEDRGQVLWSVRSIGIHLDEQLRTVLDAQPKGVLIRAAETQLAGTVQDAHPGI